MTAGDAPGLRIVSLLPSATEIVYALGLSDQLVGVTFECDFPPAARDKPSVSSPVLAGGAPEAIDREVRERVAEGRPLYDLDIDLVQSLRPDLLLAQDLCKVCAVPSGDVAAALATLGLDCEVLSLDPPDLLGVLDSLRQVAAAAGDPAAGEELASSLARRLAEVTTAVGGARPRRVVCLEWAAPPFAGGHWVPDMVAAAGGLDVLGTSGSPSYQATWDEVRALDPDLVVFMPCGYDLDGAVEQAPALLASLGPECGGEIWAVDATSFFSRPGPRLVDGVELLAQLLHPQVMAAPAADRAARIA
jgi:iron complex transport system substrate-binding protein